MPLRGDEEFNFTLKTFQEKFDVKDFVASISEGLIIRSKAEAGPFDPKPFISHFERAIDHLLTLRKDAQRSTEQMDQSTKVAERDYSRRMTELNGGFDAVGKSFSNMESRISEVGRSIMKIGEQLESIHLAKQRAKAARDLIEYYMLFSKNDTSKLDELRKDGGKEGRQQAAVILRRLKVVANEVDIPAAEAARENIDKYCEKFEKDTLKLFDKCYRKGDPKMMHHCAQTLLDFNGGASCVQIYVNQHDFFISKNRVEEISEVENDQLWDTLPDPDTLPPKKEPGLRELFGEIRSTVEQEVNIVQAVFPNPSLVMQVFLQRVFAQSIQQYMEVILNKASIISTLSFLRMLHLFHVQTSTLVNDLKGQELTFMSTRPPSGGLYDATFGSASGGAVGPIQSMASMLETAMEELFIPYTEGQRYLDVEIKSLGVLYSNYLALFTKYHMSVQKSKPTNNLRSYGFTLYDELTKQAASKAEEVSNTTSSRTAAMAAAAFLRVAGKPPDVDQSKEAPIRDEDGILTADFAETMLQWHAEAIGRCVELSAPSDLAKNAFALSRVLSEALGHSYMEVALETAQSRLETGRNELPDLSLLQVIRQIDMICHLWQQYISIAVVPLASASVTVRREMVIHNNQSVSKVEGAANSLLQKLADVVISLLNEKLKGQQKTDFKPKNDDISFARVSTDPCTQCCEILEKVKDAAKRSLTGKNLEVFLVEIGVTFHTLLLEHLKKFPVSATGGLMLAKDLKAYQDAISSFSIPTLQERYEFIRQLGTIFLVQPESLQSCISQGYLARIEPALLRPYLEKRSDWSQCAKMFDDEAGTADQSHYMTKLGTLMENFEGLKLGEGLASGFSASGFTVPTLSFTTSLR